MSGAAVPVHLGDSGTRPVLLLPFTSEHDVLRTNGEKRRQDGWNGNILPQLFVTRILIHSAASPGVPRTSGLKTTSSGMRNVPGLTDENDGFGERTGLTPDQPRLTIGLLFPQIVLVLLQESRTGSLEPEAGHVQRAHSTRKM